MGKKGDLSDLKIESVKLLLKEKHYTQQQIAEKLKISQKSVSRIKKSVESGKEYTKSRIGNCGRKPKLSHRLRRKLTNMALAQRTLTSTDLSNKLKDYGVEIAPRTVRTALCNEGLRARRPRKKQKLTKSMSQKRVSWAKELQDWTVEDWSKVCFSDESIFCVSDESSQYVRRRPGEEYRLDCVQQTVKHPTSIMVWSVISSKGTGQFHIVDGTMRHGQYIEILEHVLLPQMRKWFPSGEGIFMHDGAPCHKAKRVSEFLQKFGVNVLPWPGNSPDMNPIENLWAIVKSKIKKTKITTRENLIESLTNIWNSDEDIKKACTNAIKSMPERISALIKKKGLHTKY